MGTMIHIHRIARIQDNLEREIFNCLSRTGIRMCSVFFYAATGFFPPRWARAMTIPAVMNIIRL